ncbi:hypothetical protein QR680_011633 [Steinernema hermaphroditum]|uniref:Uncharacterized protein n=1 Tax=Steinernema hermaphroditum TaxID=289476 RepID=A0AA39I1M2_9BILA|nr:hypothetical protein QR680_011633 [Steinernema hermaphroditum]
MLVASRSVSLGVEAVNGPVDWWKEQRLGDNEQQFDDNEQQYHCPRRLSGDLRINGRTGIAIAIIVFVILLSSILASVVGCIYCYVANKKKKEQEDQEGAVLDSVTSTSA